MEYKTISIDLIKPDPNQPRKHIDLESLEEMAVSIKNEGVINAIEVDENMVIITGERRWRAAKICKLTEVPIKVCHGLSDKERFIRQVQENVNHNTMSALDTAEALERIRGWVLSSPAELRNTSKGYRYGKPGVIELHNLLGIPESTISELLDLLGTKGDLREALKDPKFPRTKAREIGATPEEYKDRMEKIITSQRDLPRETIRNMVRALVRADQYGEKEEAEELLKQDFENIPVLEAMYKINKIIPDEESRIKGPEDAQKKISQNIIALMEVLEAHPMNSFDKFHMVLVVKDIQGLGDYIKNYFKVRELLK